jgi:hypothetical protein
VWVSGSRGIFIDNSNQPQGSADTLTALETVDVLIIGAGLSSVGAAVHLRRRCPRVHPGSDVNFAGRTAVVTGAGSGIGRALAPILKQSDAACIVNMSSLFGLI